MQAVLERPHIAQLDERVVEMEENLLNLNLYHDAYMRALAVGDSIEIDYLKVNRDWYIRWFMAHDVLLGCNAHGFTIWPDAE